MVILALGVTWVLDGIEVTLAANIAGEIAEYALDGGKPGKSKEHK